MGRKKTVNQYAVFGDVACIYTVDRQGARSGCFWVDVQDLEFVLQHKWYTHGSGYVMSGSAGLLHRYLMGCSPGDGRMVDHISQDKADNRRNNLRFTSAPGNAQNIGPLPGGTSPYKGVSRQKQTGKFIAGIRCNEKSYYLGTFEDEIEAAKARDSAALMLHGENAYLNFPDGRDNVAACHANA